eukprot:m.220421 g.220421  ORF g.220421 m.220421 type:complete len:375 (+) comp31086_c0_seq1:149-1273(+)
MAGRNRSFGQDAVPRDLLTAPTGASASVVTDPLDLDALRRDLQLPDHGNGAFGLPGHGNPSLQHSTSDTALHLSDLRVALEFGSPPAVTSPRTDHGGPVHTARGHTFQKDISSTHVHAQHSPETHVLLSDFDSLLQASGNLREHTQTISQRDHTQQRIAPSIGLLPRTADGSTCSDPLQASVHTEATTTERAHAAIHSATAVLRESPPFAHPPELDDTDCLSDSEVVRQLRDIIAVKDRVIQKLQTKAADASRAEVHLKRTVRDTLVQLKAALERANDAEVKVQRDAVAFQEVLNAVQERSRNTDAEHSSLLQKCQELERRDMDRLEQLADQATQIKDLRAQLAKCRRELKHMRAEAAVSLTQQQYFETSFLNQ